LPQPLPPPPEPPPSTAINRQRYVIGSTAAVVPETWNVAVPTQLVVWHDGGVGDLPPSLDPIPGAGWVLSQVRANNNAGQIVGQNTHNGAPSAFLLAPAAP
jgi:hypothetical protein